VARRAFPPKFLNLGTMVSGLRSPVRRCNTVNTAQVGVEALPFFERPCYTFVVAPSLPTP
jgi:hypothetical protein